MIDKFGYYHGAALVRLMDDERCRAVKKQGLLGYVVNDEIFVFLKYTTKARSPWGFTFDQEDVDRCSKMAQEFKSVVLGLVCGGDGICGLHWCEAKNLLGDKPGRIATGRNHNQSYSVWGTAGEWKRKISLNRWPLLFFESDEQMENKEISI